MNSLRHYIFWVKSAAAGIVLILAMLNVPDVVQAETSSQLWGSVVLGYPKSERLYLEAEFQPKIQISSGERWRNVDFTGLVEYYPNDWIDLVGELGFGYTVQTDKISSFDVTPTIGVRFHLLEQFVKWWPHSMNWRPERLPLERFSLATLLRMEGRSLFYNGDLASQNEVRFRGRLELIAAINKSRLGDEGTLYLLTDGEIFVPIDRNVTERFVNTFRFRGGLGYRINYGSRVELLYIRGFTRDSTLEDFGEDANILDLRLIFMF